MYNWTRGSLNLNLTWFRQYNPSLARWLNRDPIGEDGGMNLFGYVGNRPIVFEDPLGLADTLFFAHFKVEVQKIDTGKEHGEWWLVHDDGMMTMYQGGAAKGTGEPITRNNGLLKLSIMDKNFHDFWTTHKQYDLEKVTCDSKVIDGVRARAEALSGKYFRYDPVLSNSNTVAGTIGPPGFVPPGGTDLFPAFNNKFDNLPPEPNIITRLRHF